MYALLLPFDASVDLTKCLKCAWACFVIKMAWLARTVRFDTAQEYLAYLAQRGITNTLDQQRAVYNGVFLETGPSVITVVLLASGIAFWQSVREHISPSDHNASVLAAIVRIHYSSMSFILTPSICRSR